MLVWGKTWLAGVVYGGEDKPGKSRIRSTNMQANSGINPTRQGLFRVDIRATAVEKDKGILF